MTTPARDDRNQQRRALDEEIASEPRLRPPDLSPGMVASPVEAHLGSVREAVSAAMQRINRTWLDRRPDDLVPLLHPDMTLVFPGFSGRVEGREPIVAGFADFCGHATIHEYREADHQVDVFGDTAVVSFTYEMVYERSGERSRATGRDLWVFARQGGEWIAVWRTMLDLAEQPA